MTYPLHGMHLIDASAGTGKTYTISGLVVRLLLERELAVRHILVVTYTRAATEDLRLRVRQMVRNCLHAFENGVGQDDFENGLLTQVEDHGQAALRLRCALQEFDEAAIFTIHAFCQRMLRENSLESGALFDTELAPDLEDLLREVAADFWRLQINRFPQSFLVFVRQKILPDNLFFFLKKIRPGLHLLPESDGLILEQLAEGALVADIERDINRGFAAFFRVWPEARDEVRRLLLDSTSLNRRSYPTEKISGWLDEMETFCREQPDNPGELPEFFEKFASDSLAGGTKKGGAAPDHPLFALCRDIRAAHLRLQELFSQGLIALRHEAARYGLAEFDRRKMEKNVFAYDDLLMKLRQALTGERGKLLGSLIRTRFPAALIDEFQDTDPVQYEIFSTLYKDFSENLLYIIGDPKQAIYSFRGADIFTYMAAISDARSSFHLSRNYRSEPGLIQAVNVLFSAAVKPFVYSRIPFQPVSAAEKHRDYLTVMGCQESPLQLWQIMRHPGETTGMAREEGQRRILVALAAEICRLLALGREGQALVGDRPLGPRDIAVLVRENNEARLVQQTLCQAGVPSVQQSMESLFATWEAAELQRVLAAVAEPGNGQRLRSALATDMLGGTCGAIVTLEQDEKSWSRWYSSFLRYHDCWRENGLAAMLRLLLAEHHVRVRLLRFGDGERRLTNILHLGEVLHCYEREEKAPPPLLLDYLAARMAAPEGRGEEYQLRLESDAERVRIVTVHRAKGLQYPVVFCPFSWAGSRSIKDVVSFHQRECGDAPALDMGSGMVEEHKELAREEELAENMRLFYVAVTRAIHRCYLVWGGFHGAESSALAWLFHGDGDLAGLKKRFKKLSDEEITAELGERIRLADGAIALVPKESIVPLPMGRAGEETGGLSRRHFGGTITARQVTSFSALASQGRHGESFAPSPESGTVFDFPRGAGPGTFMHDVFEHLDFTWITGKPEQCRELIVKKLVQHGFAPKWLDPVFAMVQNVLTVPLLRDLVLRDVTPEKRLSELEFYFPLSAVSSRTVQEILREPGGGDPAFSLPEFSVRKGFLKGFIDLVFERQGRFYLLDWKSNYLGSAYDDYRRDRLTEVMVRERYILQYHLYTVALHHHLEQRIGEYHYDEHFGGVFYLFLRGISPRHGLDCGVYHDRPDEKLVHRLSRVLVSHEKS
ncbi:MAG: exodeoxyribonuclease V subunit beta [Deltaproteobacteria bacterium]|nr:exodeoxyribonuclease V subunit beta [Deltaproteobacteria bacterium]